MKTANPFFEKQNQKRLQVAYILRNKTNYFLLCFWQNENKNVLGCEVRTGKETTVFETDSIDRTVRTFINNGSSIIQKLPFEGISISEDYLNGVLVGFWMGLERHESQGYQYDPYRNCFY